MSRFSLSVIIPVYNSEKFLKRCLDSIFNVINSDDVEVVIIDDGSTDKSAKIYESYSDKNILTIKTPNRGVSKARNLGLEKSHGDYIMFVDSDDYLLPDWLNYFRKIYDSKIDMAIFSTHYNDSIIYTKKMLVESCMGFSGSELDSCSIMHLGSKFYRKEFLTRQKILFNESLINGEDMLFNVKCITKSQSIKLFPAGFYVFTDNNPHSSTKTFGSRLIENEKNFHTEIRKEVDQKVFAKALTLSSANSIYLVANSLVLAKEPHIKEYLAPLIAGADKKDILPILANNTAILGTVRTVLIKMLLCDKINIAIFLIKLKRIAKKITYIIHVRTLELVL